MRLRVVGGSRFFILGHFLMSYLVLVDVLVANMASGKQYSRVKFSFLLKETAGALLKCIDFKTQGNDPCIRGILNQPWGIISPLLD